MIQPKLTKPGWVLGAILYLVLTCAPNTLSGMTAGELKQQMEAGRSVVVIDVRLNEVFSKGHIPEAINIPASLIPEKKLPPLGKVVVYGDGLTMDTERNAVTALNAKTGIQAEVLEGGIAAWESVHGQTTRAQGLQLEEIKYITYDQLKTAKQTEVTLVDLRSRNAYSLQSDGKSATPETTVTLTDLKKEFPEATITTSPFTMPVARQSEGQGGTSMPLVVLIDNGDGVAAMNAARKLKANGVHRFVVLAGGETAIARKGKMGLMRQGLGSMYYDGKKQP